jgi:hypothetical protein
LEHQIPGDGEATVPVPISLEGAAGAVGRASVGFDDQPGVAPEEVHDVLEQRNVHLRLGKAVAAAEREEPLLEVVAGRGRSNRVVVQ